MLTDAEADLLTLAMAFSARDLRREAPVAFERIQASTPHLRLLGYVRDYVF